MKCVSVAYFKDEAGAWRQPGLALDLPEDEAERYRKKGHVVIAETRMVAPPRTRGPRRKKADAEP